MTKENKKHIHIPIAFKLVLVTLLLLLSATVPIAYKSSELFEEELRNSQLANNTSQAIGKANEVQGLITNYIGKAEVVARLLLKSYSSEAERNSSLDLSFHKDPDLVSVFIYEQNQQKNVSLVQSALNSDFFKQYNFDVSYVQSIRAIRPLPLQSAFAGEVEVRNSTAGVGAPPLLTIAFPFVKDQYGNITHVAVTDIRLDRLAKLFASKSYQLLYLVDEDGRVISHNNETLVANYESLKSIEIVQEAILSQATKQTKRTSYFDPIGDDHFVGAYAKTPSGPIIFSQTKEAVILEPALMVRRQALYIAGMVFSAAFFLIFAFSISLTSPIEKLFEITKLIAQGKFEVRATRHIKSWDEVGRLAEAFDDMTSGLQERDKIKNMFNKFHGSSITEDLLSNSDINLGGSKKHVTVFFSDIRGFTKFSENRQPEEVVAMLNEYFHIMVGIINRHNGVVDKFIGDAIMAVWGAPRGTEEDPFKAVKACIEMRAALVELNNKRQERNEPPIKIGMALHSGEAISGTIGSDERMEYTVIGDTVNMASRIEASTKAFGTDFLISESTSEIVKEKFLLDYAGAAEVKGKTEPLKLFKVRGYINEAGDPVEVRTLYSDFVPEDADKVKIAS